MTLFEQCNRKTPEYYSTMYMDGYSPEEILNAAREKMMYAAEERKETTESEVEIVSEVKIR